MEQETKQNYATPVALVVVGVLIAAAIYFKPATPPGGQQAAVAGDDGPSKELLAKLEPVSARDHIRGSLDAPVKIVEYSDLECPFCKVFHATLQQALSEYGDKVAWVYRHFPLDKGERPLHSKAGPEAEAAECAAKLGGNEAFWTYIDAVFANTPSNNGLDSALLPKFATDIGLDRAAFEQCQKSGETKAAVEADYQSGLNVGVRGTPFSIVIGPKGERIPLNGALPLEQLKQGIDSLLK